MSQYSVVISPPDPVLEEVRQMKQALRSAINWYSSVNALAHITFNVFEAEDDEIARWEAYVASFAAQQSSFAIRLDHTSTFSNGAFFLEPDDHSDLLLIQMMKAFHQQAPFSAKESVTPHLSIGRRLKPEQLPLARALIREVDIRFVCDNLVLRRFNEGRKQYDIYKRFPFGGK